MLTLVHPLESERLLLRPIDAIGDVDAIHAYASREDVCRYIPWTPKTRDEVAVWLPRRDATSIPEPGGAAEHRQGTHHGAGERLCQRRGEGDLLAVPVEDDRELQRIAG